jgi:hypothetical protein
MDNSRIHISAASSCVNFGILKEGDVIQVGATYNTTAHPLNLAHNGNGKSVLHSLAELVKGKSKYA